MRKIFLSFMLLLAFSLLNATVLTVSNDPNKPAQFTSATTAMAAAAPGDTLYVYGSQGSYGALTITKSITIIGGGNNTRKEQFTKTIFSSIRPATGTLSDVVLDGLTIDQFEMEGTPAFNYSNFTIRNCNFPGAGIAYISATACGAQLNNWLIENSQLRVIQLISNSACQPTVSGFLVRNSIINHFNGAHSTTFVNCLGGIDVGGNFQFMSGNTFDNVIFFKITFSQASFNNNNLFRNCLTFQTAFPSQTFDLNAWTGGASGTASNCLINQNPLWLSEPTSVLLFSLPTSVTPVVWNPALQAGSAAINAGLDGTDIGLTGGLSPYNMTLEPRIPVVRRFQLVNAVVPPAGTVTIQATATKAQ